MMNINEFEFNYFLLQKKLRGFRLDEALKLFDILLNSEFELKVWEIYREQIESLPIGYCSLLRMRADLYKEENQVNGVLWCYSKLLKYEMNADVCLKISDCYTKLGLIDLAELYCIRAESYLEAPTSEFLDVLASICYKKFDFDKAIEFLNTSINMKPTEDKKYRLASFYITNKDFSHLDLMESRFKKEHGPTQYPIVHKPKWNKLMPKGNLLIHREQGFGDMIMLSRFIPQLIPYVDKIYIATQEPMKRLLENNFDFAEVVSVDDLPEDYDYHLPIMSILGALEVDLPDIKGKKYLDVIPTEVHSTKKKIGISWHGAPTGMPDRNLYLPELEPLLRRDDVQIYSFQKGIGLDKMQETFKSLNIIDLGSKFKDFYDTASYMKSMDLIVSTDNCVANLAGALGIPTILLLSKYPEFRWMNTEDKTVWYDSMSIIRQTQYEDWTDCIQELATRI